MFLARPKTFLLLALAFSAVLGFFQSRIDPYFVDVLTRIGINITLAVSLNLINGHTGQFSLGHAGFMAVGAYAAAAMTMFAGPHILSANAPMVVQLICFLLALTMGGLIAALAGVFVGAPSLRLKGDYLAIVTLGFGQIIAVVFRNIEPLGGALGLNGIPPYTNLFWAFGAAAVTVYVVTTMVNSTYGRGFLATHDDEVAAESMGIDTTRYKIVAFVIGAFFAGVAGGLFGHFNLTINPKGFDFNRSIEIVVMVIVGGMGRTGGVILAAVLLTLLPEGLRTLAGMSPSLHWIGEVRPLLYAILLIGIMLARPQGLFAFGKKPTPKP
ncbi:MAG: branched-chain amino acid ABC transporter permease [Verrucomicrobia bacterium]|jgi:branched-chain amino acid transport system permease protein|nr:MAG: branched-chain amino acid ABC transporter permease [Verrucomicrobiota bacterium]